MSSEEDDRTIIRPPSRTGQNLPTPTVAPRTGPVTAGPAGPPVMTTHTMPMTAQVPYTGTGAAPPAAPPPLTLLPGTRLGEFEVTQTIGEGGFGIVYLAWDHSLDRKVALKEYMPSSIAFRAGQTEIRPRSERHQETFEAGLRSFINEAKLLAQFDHPSLLKVYRFWEANGTAYMVMPFLEGLTVRDTVRAMPGPPDEAWIIGLLMPLFDALTMLHASKIYHRDIAPDNVLLMADTGRPLLLDFGAARRVIGDMTQALTAILKPGYAPVEQYADMPGLKQGPWTDVYALAAVVHWMILGKTPSPSVGRIFDDAYVPLAQSAAGRYSDSFLQAIDRALAVMPEKRTQSIEALRQDLMGNGNEMYLSAAPATAGLGGIAPPLGAVPRTGPTTQQTPRNPTRQALPPTQITHPSQPTQATQRTQRTQAHAATAAPQAQAAKRSAMPIVIGGIVAVVVAAGAAFALWPKPAPGPGVTVTQPGVSTPVAIDKGTPPAGTASTATATHPPVTTPATTEPTTTAQPSTTPNTTSTATVAPTTSPVVEATRPVADADKPARKPVVAKTETKSEPRDRRPESTANTTTPRNTEPAKTTEPKAATAGDNHDAECARLFQRLSIGDTDQGLIDRIRTLRCR